MEKNSKMHFSIPNYRIKLPKISYQFTEIGIVEDTVWSVRPSFDGYGNGCVEIKRSPGRGTVKIDLQVNLGWEFLTLKYGETLLDGQKSISFDCCIQNRDKKNSIHGYVTVHYKSYCAITSKQEAITQTENDIEQPLNRTQTAGTKDTVTQTEKDPSTVDENASPSPKLVNDLLHLLDSPDSFSDATLVCSTANFPVHRSILSTRSPVFTAMFKTQMQEGREGVVDIVDMESDVLMTMLRYIYGGKTDHLTHSLAGDLLFAADKYQLEELKSICVEELKVGMAANNVFRSLVLGDLHDTSLKTHAVDFICKYKNFSDLEKTEEWQSLMMERPLLAIQVTTAVVKHLQNK